MKLRPIVLSISCFRIIITSASALVTKCVMKDSVTNIQIVSMVLGSIAVMMVYQRDIFHGQPKIFFTTDTSILQNETSQGKMISCGIFNLIKFQ